MGLEREGQKPNKASYLWGQLRGNPPGELWDPVVPAWRWRERGSLMEGWSRGCWAGISSLPLPQAEPREHRAGSRVLAFGSPTCKDKGRGGHAVFAAASSSPVSGLLTLVNGSSSQPPSGQAKSPRVIPDPCLTPQVQSVSRSPWLHPPPCIQRLTSHLHLQPLAGAPASTSACPAYSPPCSSEDGSFNTQARSRLWFCSKPSCGLHLNKVEAKVWMTVHRATHDLNPILGNPILYHFPSSILLQPHHLLTVP